MKKSPTVILTAQYQNIHYALNIFMFLLLVMLVFNAIGLKYNMENIKLNFSSMLFATNNHFHILIHQLTTYKNALDNYIVSEKIKAFDVNENNKLLLEQQRVITIEEIKKFI